MVLISGEVRGAEGDILVLTPADGVRLALQKNESMLIARAEAGKSKERVRQARADGLPTLTAAVDYRRNWLLPTFVFDDNTFKIGSDNNVQGTVDLKQPIYSGGRIGAEVEAARHDVAYLEEVQRSTRQNVTAQVEGAFYDYLLARELDRLSHLVLQRARSNLAQVAALRRTGRAAEYDLLRAQVEVSTVESDSLRLSNDLEKAGMHIKDILGVDLGREIVIEAEFRVATALDVDSIESLLKTGVERRPESRQIDQLIARSQRQVSVAKAAGRPTIDLVAGGQMQFQSDKLNVSDGDEWVRSWSTGVRFQVPIFDGMRSSAGTAHAKIEVRRLELERERLRRTVQREIRQSWLDLNEASQRVGARRRTVDQATKGLQVAESRYAGGLGTQLEILDAQVLLAEAETGFATARRDRAQVLVDLERSTGVLGESVEVP